MCSNVTSPLLECVLELTRCLNLQTISAQPGLFYHQELVEQTKSVLRHVWSSCSGHCSAWASHRVPARWVQRSLKTRSMFVRSEVPFLGQFRLVSLQALATMLRSELAGWPYAVSTWSSHHSSMGFFLGAGNEGTSATVDRNCFSRAS